MGEIWKNIMSPGILHCELFLVQSWWSMVKSYLDWFGKTWLDTWLEGFGFQKNQYVLLRLNMQLLESSKLMLAINRPNSWTYFWELLCVSLVPQHPPNHAEEILASALGRQYQVWSKWFAPAKSNKNCQEATALGNHLRMDMENHPFVNIETNHRTQWG